MITPQLQAALLRSLGAVLVAAAGAGLLAYAVTGNVRAALPAAAGAAAGALGWRGGAEGLYDSKRASVGDVRPGDVTPNAP